MDPKDAEGQPGKTLQRPGCGQPCTGMFLEKGAHPQKQRRSYKIMAKPIDVLRGDGNGLGGGGGKVGEKVRAMLLHSLDLADDAAMGDVKKDISTMEAALKKLDEQESKYSAELESALQQYRELEAQSTEFDAEELNDARLELRPDMERSTVSRIQAAYDTQYRPLTMAEARQDVSKMLGEYEKSRSVLERIRNHQQEQTTLRKEEMDRDR